MKVFIVVTDTGRGMPEPDPEKIEKLISGEFYETVVEVKELK